MRLLLDENVPLSLADALVSRGHDVARLPPSLCRASDAAVLTLAVRQRRVLVTLDTDFGTLVFLQRRKPPPALVLIRLSPLRLAERLHGVADAIAAAVEPGGGFVVIDAQGVRVRPLPQR